MCKKKHFFYWDAKDAFYEVEDPAVPWMKSTLLVLTGIYVVPAKAEPFIIQPRMRWRRKRRILRRVVNSEPLTKITAIFQILMSLVVLWLQTHYSPWCSKWSFGRIWTNMRLSVVSVVKAWSEGWSHSFVFSPKGWQSIVLGLCGYIYIYLYPYNSIHMSSVQNPSLIPLYWLVHKDSSIGSL